MVKVNLGCGRDRLPGYVNVDVDPKHRPELVADITQMWLRDVDEIVIRHALEHLPYRGGESLIENMYYWLVPGGTLVVEVPDMEVISRNPDDYLWPLYTYGSQSSLLECHLSGYTRTRLLGLLLGRKFHVKGLRQFRSSVSDREGMPCVEVTATT